MIFLNAILLFGAAAFSIPLIIHLLNRSKFQTIDWGAMIFLEDAAKVNSRRLQWQTWLLLLLRCLIPIVLAICMARPMLKSYFFPDGFGISSSDQTASVLVIDNSVSMQANSNTDDKNGKGTPTTLAKESREVAEQIVARSGNKVRWSLSTWEDTGSNVQLGFSRDRSKIGERISKIDSQSGSFSIPEQISEALDQLAKSSEPSQRIIVLSDFQSSDMATLDDSTLATIREKIQQLPVKPIITFIPIGNRAKGAQPIAAPSNLSISIDQDTLSLAGVKQPWELRARIKNHSTVAVSNVPIRIQVDGAAVTTRRLDLPGNAESQLAVSFEFQNSGSHVVTASIETTESVFSDNQASWAVLALGAIPTLLVSDDFSDAKTRADASPDKESSWNDSDYLTAALGHSPRRRNTANAKDSLFSVTRVATDACTVAEMKRNRLLLLTNASELSRECWEYLGTWISQGGTLMVFPGEEMNTKWYNSLLEPSANTPSDSSQATQANRSPRQPLLPYSYLSKPETLEESQPGLTIRREYHSHPSVRFLNDPRWGAMDSLDIRKWIRMTPHDPPTVSQMRRSAPRFVSKDTSSPPASAASDPLANTVLSLTSGDPFLGLKHLGLGSIIQCATSAGDRWSNLPMRPVYLPMVQQLLVGSVPPGRWVCNIQTGETLTLPMEDMLRWIESNWSSGDQKSGDHKSADSNSNKNDSSTLVMRWTLPAASSHESPAKESTEQLINLDRDEGETGQPAIVARQPGVYTATQQFKLSTKPSGASRSIDQRTKPVSMCAQLPPRESDLRLESMEGLESLASQLGASVISTVDDYVAIESGESSELWRWFLIALLALLFAEVFLQRYLSIGGIR